MPRAVFFEHVSGIVQLATYRLGGTYEAFHVSTTSRSGGAALGLDAAGGGRDHPPGPGRLSRRDPSEAGSKKALPRGKPARNLSNQVRVRLPRTGEMVAGPDPQSGLPGRRHRVAQGHCGRHRRLDQSRKRQVGLRMGRPGGPASGVVPLRYGLRCRHPCFLRSGGLLVPDRTRQHRPRDSETGRGFAEPPGIRQRPTPQLEDCGLARVRPCLWL